MPRLPDPAEVPRDCIWPPVQGRSLLAEATRGDLALGTHPGGWLGSKAGAGEGDLGWLLFSSRHDGFPSAQVGRDRLVRQARQLATCQRRLSADRVVVLAPEDGTRWRLWQVARRFPTLREGLTVDLDTMSVERLARRLVEVAASLLELDAFLVRVEGPALTLSIDTVGEVGGSIVFVGLVSGPAAARPTVSFDLLSMIEAGQHDGPSLRAAVRHVVDQRSSRGRRDEALEQRLAAMLEAK